VNSFVIKRLRPNYWSKSLHEKAGLSQVGFVFVFACRVVLLGTGNSPASAAILPSALFEERWFARVPVGRSRFSRCCYLRIDLAFQLTPEVGPGLGRSHWDEPL
jgi:hypothetical protein